jgi:hypothetical protein
MTLPADPPKLPKWPFLVGDVALLGLAWLIAHNSPAPLVGTPLIIVVACVVIGAVFAAYPFVIEYTRAQEIALDDRQRSLETLSLTVATSAEQISIAANGLHEIAELAQRNLKVADALPLKIQEKMAAVSASFEDARADEREELEREVATLRAAESERLVIAADKIMRAVAELTKLESTAQKHLAASAEAIIRASDSIAPIEARISANIERAKRVLSESVRAAIEPALAAPTARAVALSTDTSITQEPVNYPAVIPPEVKDIKDIPNTAEGLMVADPFTAAIMSVLDSNPKSDAPAPNGVSNGLQTSSEVLAPPEPAPIPLQTIPEIVPVAPRDSASMSPILLPADSTLMKAERKRAPRKPKSVPPPPPPADSMPPTPRVEPEIAPTSVASPSAEVIVEPAPALVETPAAEVIPTAPAPVAAPAPLPEPEPVAAPSPEPEPTVAPVAIQAEVPEPASAETTEPTENSLSSDGATRLLVTAYIGIGNRLFIRGEGPGLSWDKGVPLQFVSIGKWRWESPDAGVPVTYKLYKNDSIECTAVGKQSLEPGGQQEVTAKF